MPPTYDQFALLDLRHDNDLFQESHFERFPKGGRTNIYGVATFKSILPTSKDSRPLAKLYPHAKHTLVSSFTGLTGFLSDEGRWKRVDIDLPTDNGEIISIDAFEIITESESASLVVATAVAKVDEETQENDFLLNIYGLGYTGTTIEANLLELPAHCQQILLDYVPAQISHIKLELPNQSENGFLLCGNDGRIHLYCLNGEKNRFEEISIENVAELSSLSSEPINILYIKIHHIQGKKILVVGCQDGHLYVTIYEPDGSSQSFQKRLYSPVISAIPFTTSSHPTPDAKINLLVACAVEYACIYEAIDTYGLTKSCSLEKCGDFDSVLCVHVGDVDFDGQQEIVLGTYGQQLLVYKYDVRLIDRLAFKLVWKRAFAYPIYHIGDMDLDLDGLNELLVTSMYGVHILKVDLLKSRDRLKSVIKYLRERKKIELETQQLTIQSQENEDSAKSDELTASLEDLSVEDNHLDASKEATVEELVLSDVSSSNSHDSSKEDPSSNDLET